MNVLFTPSKQFTSLAEAKRFYEKREMHEERVLSNELRATLRGGVLAVKKGKEIFPMTDVFINSALNRLRIPKNYAYMISPDLLLKNLNGRFEELDKTEFTLRLENKRGKALLGRAYSPINHDQVIGMLIDKFPESASTTKTLIQDTGTMLRVAFAIDKKVTVKKGDTQYFGFNVLNSETGHRALTDELWLYRLVCANGMVVGDQAGFDRYIHRGKGNKDEFAKIFWKSLENLSDHIPEYHKRLVESVAVPIGENYKQFQTIIEEVMGIDFYDTLTPESNLYDMVNGITLRAQSFSEVRRLEAERLAGDLLNNLSNQKN